MAINLFQSNQKDTFGTIILSICIISRLMKINTSNDLIKFSLISSFLALILQIVFVGIKIIFFSVWNLVGDYYGKGKISYAWDHPDFRSYRIELMFYFRIFLGIIFLLLPNNLMIFSENILVTPFLFENTFSSDVFDILTWFLLFIVLIVLIIQGHNWNKRLKIVRIFNSIDDWNEELRKFIREERWEELFHKFDKIESSTLNEFTNFKTWIDKFIFDSRPSVMDFLIFTLYNLEEFDWRKQFFSTNYYKLSETSTTTKFDVRELESELFEPNDSLIPFFQNYLSRRYFNMNTDLIKIGLAIKFLLEEPIDSFHSEGSKKIYDNTLELLEIYLIFYNIDKNTFMSYIPANNLQEKYTIQDLQPLREIIKERLIPTLPDKINSICSTNFHLGKLYLLNYIETFNDQVFPTNKTYFIKL